MNSHDYLHVAIAAMVALVPWVLAPIVGAALLFIIDLLRKFSWPFSGDKFVFVICIICAGAGFFLVSCASPVEERPFFKYDVPDHTNIKDWYLPPCDTYLAEWQRTKCEVGSGLRPPQG